MRDGIVVADVRAQQQRLLPVQQHLQVGDVTRVTKENAVRTARRRSDVGMAVEHGEAITMLEGAAGSCGRSRTRNIKRNFGNFLDQRCGRILPEATGRPRVVRILTNLVSENKLLDSPKVPCAAELGESFTIAASGRATASLARTAYCGRPCEDDDESAASRSILQARVERERRLAEDPILVARLGERERLLRRCRGSPSTCPPSWGNSIPSRFARRRTYRSSCRRTSPASPCPSSWA